MPTTAAKTTVKVAIINNAAKDDYFQDLWWLKEDSCLTGSLNVLANDPGSAHLLGVSQTLPASTADMVNVGTSFIPDGFHQPISVSIDAATGLLNIDAHLLNNELQSLGDGQTSSITFYYTAQMANGTYSTAKVTIDIEGTNDGPVFGSAGLSGAVNDSPADDTFAQLTGTVTATDVDANDQGLLTYGLASGETGTSTYGSFAIDAAGHWTFTPNDAAVEGLKASTTVTFDVSVSDGHGGSDIETVTITLDGVNDTATVGGDITGSVTEDGTLSASGTVTASDRDAGDTGFQTPSSLAGTYGDFHFNAATGAWSYDLRNGDANVQALGADDTPTDTLTVYSTDGTAQETITVTVHGANDAPEFDGSGTSGSVTDTADDDTFGNVTGTVAATDKDASDTLTYGLASGETGTSTYGSFAIDAAGHWTFTPNDAAVEGLKASTTVTFDVSVSDGHGGSDIETVTITLNGVNDTATVGGDITGSVTEDGTLSASGTVTASDRDAGDTGFQIPPSLAGTYGDFHFNAATGAWSYDLRNGDANVQALGADDTRTDTLTVYSTDGTAQETITVTVHGANDGPAVDPDTSHDYDLNDVNGNALVTSTSSSPGQPHQFNGTSGADVIVATNDPLNGDIVNAQGGGDTVYGRAGADTIQGMGASDTIYGGSGNDTINGGAGGDHLWGGSGNDTFVYSATGDSSGANVDTIHDFHHGYDHIDLQAVYGGTLAWGGSSATANGVWFSESGGNTIVHVDVTGAPAGDDMLITLSGTALGLTSSDFLL